MSSSEFLLFLHVSVAVISIGGGLMMQFFGIRASMSGDPSRLAAFGQDVEWIANRVFIPGSLLAFASGILLVVESDFYGFGDDWIVIGLALYATTFFAGLLFLGPEAGRIGEPMEECSPDAILWASPARRSQPASSTGATESPSRSRRPGDRPRTSSPRARRAACHRRRDRRSRRERL
jgi:hypothetical protein